MKKEYDFSKAEQGKFYRSKMKVRVPKGRNFGDKPETNICLDSRLRGNDKQVKAIRKPNG